MKRRVLSCLMALVLVFGLLPATAFAEDEATASTAKTIYVDATNGNDEQVGVGTTAEKAYKTLKTAVTAAASGDTIMLGEGNYTLYGVRSEGHTKDKDLTFVGQGADKTTWGIGATMPDPTKFGTEYNSDYSFDGAGTIKFEQMTLQSSKADYLGFARADKTVVENCIINGKTFYWGYTSAEFKNTTFNCPSGDYALWTYSSPTMTFDRCTFNSSGKVINVYNEGGTPDVTIDFKNCTVNSNNPDSKDSKSVLNINDRLVNSFTINISGTNIINGIKADGIAKTEGSHKEYDKNQVDVTCSKLFEFNTKYDNPSANQYANSGKTVVSIDGKIVWQNGRMVSHDYTDGYKDNAFEVTYGEWSKNPDGTQSREVTKTCKYCGYEETYTETKEADPIDWDVSRSKTATRLDKKTWTSDVTLSLPSAEENLASDVVFVLDKSTSAEMEAQALGMLTALKEQTANTGAKVKVGVVIFNKQANVTASLTDLATGYETIEAAIKQEISSGTNTHAGMLAGKQMLDEDTAVAANRKYLIFVSDGITYMYNAEPTATAWSFKADSWNHWVGPDNWNSKYGSNNPPVDWSAWMTAIGKQVADQGTEFEYPYNGTATKCTPEDDTYKNYANSVDKALYLTYQVYQEAQAAGYNCYAVAKKVETDYLWGPDFMRYLADGETVDFDKIQNDILYAVSAGSTVEDKMGDAFDFVPGSLKLTVGGKELESKADGNVTYFGNDAENLDENSYRFKVLYAPDADGFVWTINENVSNFAPVQLTYTVKLTKPETAPGTYGTEDLKGEKDVPAEKALFTNAYAVLNAKNSAGVPLKPLDFPKPSLAYTISGGGDGGGGDGSATYYYFAIEKVDAQDGSVLSGAKFGLFLDGKQIATATSNRSGIAMFRVNESDYRKINAKSDLYYQELTAPEGYVVNSDEVSIEKSDLTTSRSKAEKDAETVRNYRGSTPDLLNGDDHFAYVIGYQDGCVHPNALITRAETATIFFRLLKDDVRDDNLRTSNTFADVPNDHWANTTISTMAGLGIVQGRSSTAFDPNASITRAEFAAICARFDTGTSSGTQTFSDISGHWAEKYIQRAAELGWIKGFEDGTFRPDTYITRAQAMTMINRVLNRIPEENSDLLPDMNVWPDCNPGDWFYLAVQEATNSHNYKHKAGNYETWTSMKQDPDWTRYEN